MSSCMTMYDHRTLLCVWYCLAWHSCITSYDKFTVILHPSGYFGRLWAVFEWATFAARSPECQGGDSTERALTDTYLVLVFWCFCSSMVHENMGTLLNMYCSLLKHFFQEQVFPKRFQYLLAWQHIYSRRLQPLDSLGVSPAGVGTTRRRLAWQVENLQWAVIFIPIPLPEKVLQTSNCSVWLYMFVIQTVLGSCARMTHTNQEVNLADRTFRGSPSPRHPKQARSA